MRLVPARSGVRHPRQFVKVRPLRLEPLEDRRLLSLQGDVLFPADSPWNQRVASAPVAGNSDTLVAAIGTTARLHPDFGTIYEGGYIGIPYVVVSGTQAKVPVVIDAYADESDLLPVPIPPGAPIEGDPLPASQNDGDRHLIVYDKDNNLAYELFNVSRPSENSDGKWHADSEAVWQMDVNDFRTPGDTSADAAGLPILPGLVRPEEVLDQGVINHALRFTVPRSRNSYAFPASHQAGINDSTLPRMGERFRLKASFDISGYSAANRVILQALKDYGMIVADNGSSWYLSGEPSSRWNDDDLHVLSNLRGSNFEAVSLRPIVTSLDQTSGSTAGGTAVTIRGSNYSGAAGQLTVMFGTTQAANVSIVSDTMLVATSPPHAAGLVDVTVVSPYGTSATSTADRFTFAASSASTVQGRRLFYNNSYFDNAANNPNFNNDSAIAGDKAALLPGGGMSTFANLSSYSTGINGIMVDLSAGASHASITASDFSFKVSTPATVNAPSTWPALATAPNVVVRAGAGTGGADRIELAWPAGTIVDRWLQVTVKANTRTGLAADDHFYFGSLTADSGQGNDATLAFRDSTDVIATRNHQASDLNSPTNLYDYNRDNDVDSTDVILARSSGGAGELAMINVGPAGPFAPTVGGGSNEVAMALSLTEMADDEVAGSAGGGPNRLDDQHSAAGSQATRRATRLPEALDLAWLRTWHRPMALEATAKGWPQRGRLLTSMLDEFDAL